MQARSGFETADYRTKLEKVIQEIPELDFVKSTSRTGVSIITVSIQESYTNMRPIWDKPSAQKSRVQPKDMPDGVIGPEVNDEFGDVFGIVVTLTGPEFSYAELKDIADQARDEFLRVPEVAKVEIYGAQEERIFIEYNNARLSELGLSPTQLMQMLENRNIVVSRWRHYAGYGNVLSWSQVVTLNPWKISATPLSPFPAATTLFI